MSRSQSSQFIMQILWLLAAKYGLALPPIRCHECVYVNSTNEDAQRDLLDALRLGRQLPADLINSDCQMEPSKLVMCPVGACVQLSIHANTENYGGPVLFDLMRSAGSARSMDESYVRGISQATISLRTCLSNALALVMPPANAKTFRLPFMAVRDVICAQMQDKTLGVHAQANLCVCTTGHACNSIAIHRRQVPPAEPVKDIIHKEFRMVCPPPDKSLHAISCANDCLSQAQCIDKADDAKTEENTTPVCCKEQCHHLCDFSVYNCTDLRFTNQKLSEKTAKLQTAKTQSQPAASGMPQNTRTCFQAPKRKLEHCSTLGGLLRVKGNFSSYNGPNIFDISRFIDNVGQINELGTVDLVVRGCLEYILPQLLYNGFPPLSKAVTHFNAKIIGFGMTLEIQILTCNTDNCNGNIFTDVSARHYSEGILYPDNLPRGLDPQNETAIQNSSQNDQFEQMLIDESVSNSMRSSVVHQLLMSSIVICFMLPKIIR